MALDKAIFWRDGVRPVFGAGYRVIGAAAGWDALPAVATVTTTGNITALTSDARVIRMNNASDATIQGIAAGRAGQIITIISVGAGHVYLAHQNGSATAADRLINFATLQNTPLAAGVGSATLTYDDTTARWRLSDHAQGTPIDFTYNGADFAASSGTWTVDSGDVKALDYYLVGRIVTINVVVKTTSVSATPATLQWNGLPSGLRPLFTTEVVTQVLDNSAKLAGIMAVIASTGQFQCERIDGASWATATNATNAGGTIVYEVA